MSRIIKSENWAVLAGSIAEVLCVPGNEEFASRAAAAFRQGVPGEYLAIVVEQINRIVRLTYNGRQRVMAQSLMETLGNYGLVENSTANSA